ncbi:glycosyltransferase [Kocuria rosea]|uniref:glycosyltransferase n=1 Tax=Kocuria rosea TaxID=1275 RepID=UPI002559B268|nr:glycosyltransferase [Kocuria rosea]
MKIIQVVTYISPDGAYGGPARVAMNQAKALRDMGHDVVVVAAAGGFKGPLPKEYDGFPVHLFPSRRILPKTGFAGLCSPSLTIWLTKAVRDADVVHVHLARDLVALPAAALALMVGKRLVVQTHGMIDATEKWLAKPLDWFLTRPVLAKASSCLYLTSEERDDLQGVAKRSLNLEHLKNGVPMPREEARGVPVKLDQPASVLFLARLHEIKRPLTFVKAAQTIIERGHDVRFRLAGPDEGQAAAVQDAIDANGLGSNIMYEGPVAPHETATRLAQCDVYVLPSLDETFPMSVIEALSVGKPVIVTKTCGLAPFIEKSGSGIVVDGSAEEISEAIMKIVDDPITRNDMEKRARALAREEFAISSVARQLINIYSAIKK